MRYSESVIQYLQKSGWHDGRFVEDSIFNKWLAECSEFTLFRRAETVIREFGGLQFIQGLPGEECLREDFEIDPTLCVGEADRFAVYEDYFNSKIYPLGECCNYSFLVMDDAGRVMMFGTSDVILGYSFDEALETLILGRKGELIPDF